MANDDWTGSLWSSLQEGSVRSLAVGQNEDGRLEVFGVAADDSVYHIAQTILPLGNFTFAADISAENRAKLLDRHRFALARIGACGNLSASEKDKLNEAYRRPIHHTTLNQAGANASAQVGGSQLNVNFGVLFPQGDVARSHCMTTARAALPASTRSVANWCATEVGGC